MYIYIYIHVFSEDGEVHGREPARLRGARRGARQRQGCVYNDVMRQIAIIID